MPQPNDLSRSLVALNQDDTLIAVIEMSRSSWLVAGIVPGLARHPLKKLAPDEAALLGLLERWRGEATQAGRVITRIAVAYEAGRDGFWLARWLRAPGLEAYVIHPTSVAGSREHRRAKTDRLDTALLKRVFLGWLRGEPGHCTMAAIPTQGSRMSLACDDLEHVGVVPGSLLAPAAEAGLGGPVSGDQVESDLAQESEVARSRPVAHAAVIFAEGDVQHPMQRVLNAPMSADRPDQDSGIIVAACEEVADLGLDPAGAVDAPDRLDGQNRTQVRPAVQGRE